MQAFIKIRRKPPAFRQGVYGTFGKLSELRIQTEKKIYLQIGKKADIIAHGISVLKTL